MSVCVCVCVWRGLVFCTHTRVWGGGGKFGCVFVEGGGVNVSV